MAYPSKLIPTTVVGSYPQPDWLVDRAMLTSRLVPRVHAPEIWRKGETDLATRQDEATIAAIRDMEAAGIDIISDGEIRRESYSNYFALSLGGIDGDNPAEVIGRTGAITRVPRVVGPIRRLRAVEVRDAEFLRANTAGATKITLPGPFTMAQQAKDDFYGDEEAMAMAYAVAVNEELRAIKATGIDVVQLDEPWLQARPEQAMRYGLKVLNRALEGIGGVTVVHLCFGYAAMVNSKPSGYSFLPQLADSAATQISIEAAQPRLDLGVLRDLGGKTVMLGVLDLGATAVETADEVAARLTAALAFIAPDRLVAAPDCGMKYTPLAIARGKLAALAEGAGLVRRKLAGGAPAPQPG
jgi:5-methyltetrahydropteroyltriglutamate--homocysteine methyltransferase